jgi:hypothetical protein
MLDLSGVESEAAPFSSRQLWRWQQPQIDAPAHFVTMVRPPARGTAEQIKGNPNFHIDYLACRDAKMKSIKPPSCVRIAART